MPSNPRQRKTGTMNDPTRRWEAGKPAAAAQHVPIAAAAMITLEGVLRSDFGNEALEPKWLEPKWLRMISSSSCFPFFYVFARAALDNVFVLCFLWKTRKHVK